ncbi:MAG: hypothetical protein AAFO07_31355, partial [Bacteroidota bacterium]
MSRIKKLERFDRSEEDQNDLMYTVFYNENQQPLEEIEYTQSGALLSHNRYAYDDSKRLIKEIIQGEEEMATQTVDYVYEGTHKVTKITTYADGSTEKEVKTTIDQTTTTEMLDGDDSVVERMVESFRQDGK